MQHSLSDSLGVRATCTAAARRFGDHLALRALLKAYQLVATALGVRLGQLRESGQPDAERFARLHELSWQLPAALAAARVLGERWEKVPERHRPHYTPEQRFEILRLKAVLALTAKETAKLFALSPATVHRWISELARAQAGDPDTPAIGRKFQPTPPVRRYADAFRHLVSTLSVHGFGGAERIARVIARHGFKISARTVARIRKESTIPPIAPHTAPPERVGPRAVPPPPEREVAVRARSPLDKVLIDITQVRALFGLLTFRLAVVLDLFSRFPLAFAVFRTEPTALEMVMLVERATRHGRPRVLISDQGAQFRAPLFGAALQTLGIEHRFGAVHRHGSIATLERLWRTVKAALGVRWLRRDLILDDFHRHVGIALQHYSFHQPHASLDGATPAEVFLRLPPAHEASIYAPRGRPGEVVAFPKFEVAHIAPGFPVLVRRAA